MKIVVAILTTGVRNKTFKICIESLFRQNIPSFIDMDILVVENNQKALSSITQIIEPYKEHSNINIFHCLEVKPGIPFARNCALSFAQINGYSHLAFIDDDAFAVNNWIHELTIDIDSFDVVSGPQCALFPEDIPSFFKLAKVYRERVINHNADIQWAATNNVLISIDTLKRLNLRFNETLIHGGEDKELFLRVSKLGGKIKWRSNAVVKEHIVRERLNLKWALNRTFRMGATGFKIESCNKNRHKTYLICLFKGSAYLLKGFLSFIPFLISSKYSILDSLCDISHGLGFFYGIFTRGRVKSYA
nr:glycosyltransferase family 2 protein [Psychromonas sp. RZ22]